MAEKNKEIFENNLVTRKDLAETETKIVKWVVGVMIAQVALILSAMTILFNTFLP